MKILKIYLQIFKTQSLKEIIKKLKNHIIN